MTTVGVSSSRVLRFGFVFGLEPCKISDVHLKPRDTTRYRLQPAVQSTTVEELHCKSRQVHFSSKFWNDILRTAYINFLTAYSPFLQKGTSPRLMRLVISHVSGTCLHLQKREVRTCLLLNYGLVCFCNVPPQIVL